MDAQKPVVSYFVKPFQSPGADEEFLRKLSMKIEKEKEDVEWGLSVETSKSTTMFSKSKTTNHVIDCSEESFCHAGYALRQNYLRSYTFTRKESLKDKTKKLWKELWLQKTMNSDDNDDRYKDTEGKDDRLQPARSSNNKDGSTKDDVVSSRQSASRLLLSCVSKIDVHD